MSDEQKSIPMDERQRFMNAREQPTLRDQMAMASLTGLLASDVADNITYEDLAEHVYKIADAMLKARKETPNG